MWLQRTDASGNLEHRVGVLLRVDHERARRADLGLPVAVLSLTGFTGHLNTAGDESCVHPVGLRL